MRRQKRVGICSAIQQCVEKRHVAAGDRVRKKRDALPLGRRRRRVLAEEQPNFIVFARLQRSGQSAPRAGCPFRQYGQTLFRGFNDLRIPAIERKAQKVLSVRTRFFRFKIS